MQTRRESHVFLAFAFWTAPSLDVSIFIAFGSNHRMTQFVGIAESGTNRLTAIIFGSVEFMAVEDHIEKQIG